MEEFTLDYKGITYSAKYSLNEDTLTVYLSDGTSRSTKLDGVNPISAVKVHLKSYAIMQYRKNNR